jgi:hypothetical protein
VAALLLANGTGFLSAFEQSQLDALAYLFLRLHSHGFLVAQIFWGLWLFPFGLLVIRSGFIPRVLGFLLIIACFGYLAASFTSLLLPRYGHLVSSVAMIAEGLGELSTVLWLLIWGAKAPPVTGQSVIASAA